MMRIKPRNKVFCIAMMLLGVGLLDKISVAQDCPPGRNCEVARSCPLQQDTRNCAAFDLVCQAAKASQNAAYQAAKAACEAQKAAEKATCERTKAEEQAACDAKQKASAARPSDCSSPRQCNASRDCTLQVDTRSCAVKGPLGANINDPFCEAAKAAQNAGYQAAKAACEAQNAAEKMDCERVKEQERLACEAGKSGQPSKSLPAKKAAADCAPRRNCEATRSCPLQVDTRNCRIKAAFGMEIIDPACEAAKGAQNAAYQAAKTACEAQRALERLDCERINAQERLACEAKKTSK